MPTWYAGSGRKTLKIDLSLEEAESGSHPGPCDEDVKRLLFRPHVAEQVAKWTMQDLQGELSEYGAWKADELENRRTNEERMLWLACGDLVQEAHENKV